MQKKPISITSVIIILLYLRKDYDMKTIEDIRQMLVDNIQLSKNILKAIDELGNVAYHKSLQTTMDFTERWLTATQIATELGVDCSLVGYTASAVGLKKTSDCRKIKGKYMYNSTAYEVIRDNVDAYMDVCGKRYSLNTK